MSDVINTAKAVLEVVFSESYTLNKKDVEMLDMFKKMYRESFGETSRIPKELEHRNNLACHAEPVISHLTQNLAPPYPTQKKSLSSSCNTNVRVKLASYSRENGTMQLL